MRNDIVIVIPLSRAVSSNLKLTITFFCSVVWHHGHKVLAKALKPFSTSLALPGLPDSVTTVKICAT